VRITRPDRTRAYVALGDFDEAAGRLIADKLAVLERAAKLGQVPDARVLRWVADQPAWLQSRMVDAGLVQIDEDELPTRSRHTVGELTDKVMRHWAAEASEVTLASYRQGIKSFEEFFGRGHDLERIDAEAMDEFKVHLKQKRTNEKALAAATISKQVKVVRRLLRTAALWQWIKSNPAGHLKAGKQTNDKRNHPVPAELVLKLMDEADAEWKVIFALARWGGVRTPSESLRLKWQHVNFAEGWIRIESPKTAKQGKDHRFIPMFPQLRGPLAELYEIAPAGGEGFVLPRYCHSSGNLRTQAGKIAARAGRVLPDKFFQNCRATRATEILEQYGAVQLVAWLGHTLEISLAHYQQPIKTGTDQWRAVVEAPKSGTVAQNFVFHDLSGGVRHTNGPESNQAADVVTTPENLSYLSNLENPDGEVRGMSVGREGFELP
jgi:integrase